MRRSINFDGQPAFKTSEVDDVAAMRKLAAEAKAAGALSKLLPKQHLGQSHLAAEVASESDIGGIRANRAMPDASFDPSTTQLR